MTNDLISFSCQHLCTEDYVVIWLRDIKSFMDTMIFIVFKTYWLLVVTNISTRGHCLKLFKPTICTGIRGHSFTVWIVNPRNPPPESVVTARSVNSLKNRLDDHWTELNSGYSLQLSTRYTIRLMYKDLDIWSFILSASRILQFYYILFYED